MIYPKDETRYQSGMVSSIIEFKIKGPVVQIPYDSACLVMTVKSEIGEQKWDGFYLGIRFKLVH